MSRELISNDTIAVCCKPVIALLVSGSIKLNSESSIVRLTCIDDQNVEYLIFEYNYLTAPSECFTLNKIGEETSLLVNIKRIKRFLVKVVDAEFVFDSYSGFTAVNTLVTTLESPQKIITETLQDKINTVNENLIRKNKYWRAGVTPYTNLSYAERKKILGENYPIGFEYYRAGIFEFTPIEAIQSVTKSVGSSSSVFVGDFDWRTRHGATIPYSPYFDGNPDVGETENGWMTSAKNQLSGSNCTMCCFIYAPIGAFEAFLNLYYNQHINVDLSEQFVLSCGNSSSACSSGGSLLQSLHFMKNYGSIPESCFPWKDNYVACIDQCSSPSFNVKMGGILQEPYYPSEAILKKDLIKYGPLSVSNFNPNGGGGHAMVLVGYKTLKVGDVVNLGNGYGGNITVDLNSTLVGKTCWIFKNSVGPTFGVGGYIYGVTNSDISGEKVFVELYAILPPIESSGLNKTILCRDDDCDGYYNWGIGPKPSFCPPCPDQPDGDDSNALLGSMDEFGNIAVIQNATIPSQTISLGVNQVIESKIAPIEVGSSGNSFIVNGNGNVGGSVLFRARTSMTFGSGFEVQKGGVVDVEFICR